MQWTLLTWVMLRVKLEGKNGVLIWLVRFNHPVLVVDGWLGKAAIKEKEIEKGTHKSLLYQHNTKPLPHAVWADNNYFVKTLSNFHSPTIVQDGMKRRVRDPVTKRRASEQNNVDYNAQQID